MALQPIVLHQGNTEQLQITITPAVSTDDLSLITSLVVIIKDSPRVPDATAGVVTLSSANPAQITITRQTKTVIEAIVYLPASLTVDPYTRCWRCDAYVGTAYRTAIYGPVTVVDL